MINNSNFHATCVHDCVSPVVKHDLIFDLQIAVLPPLYLQYWEKNRDTALIRIEQTPPAPFLHCTIFTWAGALNFFEPSDFPNSSLPHNSFKNNNKEWEEHWHSPWERMWRRSYGVIRVGASGCGLGSNYKTLPIYLQFINIIYSRYKIIQQIFKSLYTYKLKSHEYING